MKLIYERQDLHDLVLSDARAKGLITGDEGTGWAIEWVRAEAGPFGPDHIELTIGERHATDSAPAVVQTNGAMARH